MKPKYKFGLIGHRIGYSRSPSIFKAIFDYLEVEGSFENFDLAPDKLQLAFDNNSFAEISGLSVTIPHKKAVVELLDKLDPVAEILQAINSISFGNEGTFGSNTDWIGFAQPLDEYKAQLNNASAIVLGYGGSAKAVIYSLYSNFNIREISVVGRDLTKAKENLTTLQESLSALNLEFLNHIKPAQLQERNPAIIINCTPLGGFNSPDLSPLPSGLVLDFDTIYYDLNYNSNNQTVARLRNLGMTTIDGSAMLVAQALESFRLWTGRDDVPFDPIYKAVFGGE